MSAEPHSYLSESPFIAGRDLVASFHRGDRMTIIDSHWAKTENSAWEAYVSRHLPGAMFCNPLIHLASTPSRANGRNPLPEPDRLQRTIQDWGVSPDKPVYTYDAGSNLYAARAWWILRWAGVQNVRILDGGTDAWMSAGGDVAGGIGALRGRGTAQVAPHSMPVLAIEDVDQWLDSAKLLVDARDNPRFTGRKEHFDHQAGSIPRAINIPCDTFQDEAGNLVAPERVREILGEHGITRGEDVAVYSGSGLHSSLFIAIMEHAGLLGAWNFIGGWSQWSASSSRPIARG